MYPVPTECPVCHDDLHVSQLVCHTCGAEIRGHFEMDRLSQLIPEQRYFVEVFLLCEGKLNCVQDELGISYPTVRNRLDEIIHALKRERTVESPVPDVPPVQPATPIHAVDTAQHQEILDRLARQEINLDEALQLLEEI